MKHLISLELKRNRLKPYHIASFIIAITMLAFLYLTAAIPTIDPKDEDNAILFFYPSLIQLNHIVSMAIFTILASVMGSKIIIEEYAGKRSILLFSYPIARKKILGAKIVLVLFYTTFSMFLCGITNQTLFFITEALAPLCRDRITFFTIISSFLSLLCYSLLSGMLGMIAIWIGFMKKSVSVTIVSAVIIVTIFCQLCALSITLHTVLFGIFCIVTIFTLLVIKHIFHRVEIEEVLS